MTCNSDSEWVSPCIFKLTQHLELSHPFYGLYCQIFQTNNLMSVIENVTPNSMKCILVSLDVFLIRMKHQVFPSSLNFMLKMNLLIKCSIYIDDNVNKGFYVYMQVICPLAELMLLQGSLHQSLVGHDGHVSVNLFLHLQKDKICGRFFFFSFAHYLLLMAEMVADPKSVWLGVCMFQLHFCNDINI